MKKTNWDAVEKHYEQCKEALKYMAEHPLTHEQAVEQTNKLHNKQ